MSSFDPTGLTIDRLDDIFNKIIADLKSLWGDNVKSSPDSVIGGLVTIFSEAVADQNELIESVVSAFQPSKAIGVFQSELVRFNGIERNENQFSTVNLECFADAAVATVISIGAIVEDPDTGIQVQTTAIGNIPAGTSALVPAEAIEPGALVIEANTMTKIVTPEFGWASVNNPSAGETGQAEEADPLLRARRDIASERKASCDTTSMYTAIFDIQDVTDVYVHSNRGSTVDFLGTPPGSVWCIIEGGDAADFIEQISQHLPGGVRTYGSYLGVYNNPVTGQSEVILYSRPALKSTWLIVDLSKTPEYPGDGDDQISTKLQEYFETNQTLGARVVNSRLYSVVNEVPGHSINAIYQGFSASPTSEADLSVNVDEKAVTDDSRISVV